MDLAKYSAQRYDGFMSNENHQDVKQYDLRIAILSLTIVSAILLANVVVNALSKVSEYHRNGQNFSPSDPWVTELSSRSEEHTSELQSLTNLVCRLLLEKKKKKHNI